MLSSKKAGYSSIEIDEETPEIGKNNKLLINEELTTSTTCFLQVKRLPHIFICISVFMICFFKMMLSASPIASPLTFFDCVPGKFSSLEQLPSSVWHTTEGYRLPYYSTTDIDKLKQRTFTSAVIIQHGFQGLVLKLKKFLFSK